MRLEAFLARLEGVTGSAPQWAARCPGHEDHSASLTVSAGHEGRILVTCWAGCDLQDVCRGAGVTVADLFDVEAKRQESLGLGVMLQRALTPELPGADEILRDSNLLQRSPATLA